MSSPDDEREAPPAERLIVPGSPGRHGDADDVPADVRDLGSASRSCLVIIAILLALVLFLCAFLVLRSVFGG